MDKIHCSDINASGRFTGDQKWGSQSYFPCRDQLLGISAGTVEEARAAEKAGADYIGVGAVFGTSTKKDARNLSVEKLREISASVSIPVVAIGGINRSNVGELSGSDVDGIAVISALFGAERPGEAAAELAELAKEIRDSE